MLCCVASRQRTASERQRRRTAVHAQLSLWEERKASGAIAAWSTLTDEHRAAIIATLARLIVQMVVAVDGRERPHE
jgi:hypothetical protein